jgi:hypothetical protein
VQVVEDQDGRPRGGEALQQRADRAVGLVALALQPAHVGRRDVAERGEHARQLGEPLRSERLEPARVDLGQPAVDRVDHDGERELALELRRAAREHEVVAAGSERLELAEQARLADTGLADERQHRRRAPSEALERALNPSHLGIPADEPFGRLGRHGVAQSVPALDRGDTYVRSSGSVM